VSQIGGGVAGRSLRGRESGSGAIAGDPLLQPWWALQPAV